MIRNFFPEILEIKSLSKMRIVGIIRKRIIQVLDFACPEAFDVAGVYGTVCPHALDVGAG
jgi:hypothetical protein